MRRNYKSLWISYRDGCHISIWIEYDIRCIVTLKDLRVPRKAFVVKPQLKKNTNEKNNSGQLDPGRRCIRGIVFFFECESLSLEILFSVISRQFGSSRVN